jgi:hypothetical protein
MAYFLTAKQVRYILPVLPFLAILAVMGIKDLLEKLGEGTYYSPLPFIKNITTILKFIIFSAITILLIVNLVYLKGRMNIIKPFPYISGHETREAFLKRHLLHFNAVEYINSSLPDNAVVFTMFLGRRGYYFNRNYKNESSFGMNTLQHMINDSDDENKFVEYVRSMGATHILMRTDLVNRYLKDNFSKDSINRFLTLEKKYWKKIYQDDGYTIWDIRIRRLSQ